MNEYISSGQASREGRNIIVERGSFDCALMAKEYANIVYKSKCGGWSD